MTGREALIPWGETYERDVKACAAIFKRVHHWAREEDIRWHAEKLRGLVSKDPPMWSTIGISVVASRNFCYLRIDPNIAALRV